VLTVICSNFKNTVSLLDTESACACDNMAAMLVSMMSLLLCVILVFTYLSVFTQIELS